MAISGLEYMNDGECSYVGTDTYGNNLYAAPQPMLEKILEMSLYVDYQCLILYEGDGDENMNYDYVKNGYSNSANNNNDDNENNNYYYYQSTSEATQEYTMTLFNEVFEQFRYCTLCIDYPSYQDGYFNGDYGTDDDDLINQCWKFYSHTTYHCKLDCIATADRQGTIGVFKYGNTYYGQEWDGTSQSGRYKRYDSFKHSYVTAGASDRWSNSGANVFFVFNAFLLFCTYQAYLHKDQVQQILDGSFENEQQRKPKSNTTSSRKRNPKKEALLSEKEKQWVDISSLARIGSSVGNELVHTMKYSLGVDKSRHRSSRKKNQRRNSRHAPSRHTTTTKISRTSAKPRTPPLKIMTTDAQISSKKSEPASKKSERQHNTVSGLKPKVFVKPKKPRTTKGRRGSNQGKRTASKNAGRLNNVNRVEALYEPPIIPSSLPAGSRAKIRNDDQKSRAQFDLRSLESDSESESLYSSATDEWSSNYSVETDESSINTTENFNRSTTQSFDNRSIDLKRTKKEKAANAAKSVLEKYKSSYHARTEGKVPPNSSANTNVSIESNDSMDSDDFSILWNKDLNRK